MKEAHSQGERGVNTLIAKRGGKKNTDYGGDGEKKDKRDESKCGPL